MWGILLVLLSARLSSGWVEPPKKLVYVQVLTTPGYFAPVELYPTSESSEDDWPYGLGQPTKVGKKQEFEVGKLLRKLYDNFITTDPNEVEVFSAVEDRATLGALGLMASFYAPRPEWEFAPGFAWQPITISHQHQADKFFYDEDYCMEMYNDRLGIMRSPAVRNLTSRNRGLYYLLTKKSGMFIQSMFDVARLFDILEKESDAHLSVPPWATAYWPQMRKVTNEAYGWRYNSTVSQMLKIGSLIDLVISRMRVKTPDYDPSPKVLTSVYMTHDWNMAAILQAFRQFNGRPPPCTSIILELYKTEYEKNKEDFLVRTLLLNSTRPELGVQKPIVIQLADCDEYCPLQSYVDYFKDIIPDNFRKQCGSTENVIIQYSDY